MQWTGYLHGAVEKRDVGPAEASPPPQMIWRSAQALES